MADIHRVRVGLTGFIGAPGVCTFYGLDGPALQAPLRQFFAACKSQFPLDVQIKVETNGDVLDPATGKITNTWIGTDQPIVQGSSGGVYVAPVGILVRWLTAVVADGKRVRGRTFLVPGSGDSYDIAGQVNPAAQGVVAVAAAAFVAAASPSLIIWHRPFKGSAATATRPARPAHIGSAAGVTGSGVGTKAVVLRSRRD
jgi:hypothetical protein